MSTDEDVLLREVEEDLKYEKQLDFLKAYGPWVAGAAAILVAGVAGMQIWSGMQDQSRATAAEAFLTAAVESPEAPLQAADALAQVSGQLEGGYKGLAGLREAGLLLAGDDKPAALASFRSVYDDPSLPDRMRDLARLRAALVMLDSDAPSAAALSTTVTTEAFKPNALEIEAVASLATGNYDRAYTLFTSLAADETAGAGVASRASALAPVADAGRRGVTLSPETSAAEDFIKSFSDQLGDEGVLPTLPEPATDASETDGAPN